MIKLYILLILKLILILNSLLKQKFKYKKIYCIIEFKKTIKIQKINYLKKLPSKMNMKRNMFSFFFFF